MTASIDYREYNPFDPESTLNPYPYYEALRRDAPVFRVPANDLWVVSRHADVMSVLHDADLYSNEALAAAVTRPGQYSPDEVPGVDDEPMAVSIIGTDGEYHARLRSIVSRGFTPRRVAEMEPRIREITRGLLARWCEGGKCEFISDLAAPLPVSVIAEMLGVDLERRDDFRRWSEAMIVAVFEDTTPEQAAHISICMGEMEEWLDGVIEERLRHPAEDFISTLIRAETEDALSHNEMQTFAFTLLVAGSITTTYLLGNAMLALLSHPAAFSAIVGDNSLIPAMLEETLRYDAPVQLMLRTAERDVDIAGVPIPKGATVVPLIGSANRDGNVFANPNNFHLGRDNQTHVAFGHGVHFCLGASLARLEARIAFEELLARMRDPARLGEPEREPSLLLRGPSRLELSFTPVEVPVQTAAL